MLWIAFKNYYLRDEGQQLSRETETKCSCELLSKIIIFVMKDNQWLTSRECQTVVNCFQKLLSSWWRTTPPGTFREPRWLWIAFKNYYLRDEGQRDIFFYRRIGSCELLSKIIIFVMKDNVIRYSMKVILVVNCFQKLLSSWWRTTYFCVRCNANRLWIAFKNYYLRDEGQLRHII